MPTHRNACQPAAHHRIKNIIHQNAGALKMIVIRNKGFAWVCGGCLVFWVFLMVAIWIGWM